MVKSTIIREKPAFLRQRQWEYILALQKHRGIRWMAAEELGVKENAVEKMLTLIRKKVKSAYRFKRTYGSLIERRR